MQQRKLGYTDLNLTTIGFGAWAIGGPWDYGWGPQDDDDVRHKNGHRHDPELGPNLTLSEALRRIAARHGRSVGQLAITWALHRPKLTAALVGARRPGQVAEIAPASDWTLSEAEIAEIDGLPLARRGNWAEAEEAGRIFEC